jgi:microcystin degradation protein MlrC
MNTKRIGLIGILHESNTFAAKPTTLASFQEATLSTGEEFRKRFANGLHETSGFFQSLEKHNIQAVPIIMGWATPSGAVTKQTLDTLIAMMNDQLDKAGHLDGLLIAPHGAGVSEEFPDMDGHWMSLLRQRFPRPFPIIATCDPHANLTPKMVAAVDALTAYRSNPHLDQRIRGIEAGDLMARTLKGEIKPTVAASFPPIAINIERQLTTAEPCLSMYKMADELLKTPGVLTNSVVLGFPYSDVHELGSAFITVTDNNPALAQKLSNDMAAWLTAHRTDFIGQMISVEDAVKDAISSPGPVGLLDMGDNVGGGSAADGTTLAFALEKAMQEKAAQGISLKSFICIYDPQAQSQARAAGPGAKLTLTMGGKSDDKHGKPFTASVTVNQLADGKYKETKPTHGGFTDFDMGPTAIVQTTHGLVIMLTSLRAFPTSLVQLLAFNLDPASFQTIVAKGVHAPVGAYAAVCKKMIRVNTPGTTNADMLTFTYKNRRKPLFPFEQ